MIKGSKHLAKSIQKMSLSNKGKHRSSTTEFKKGSSGFTGKHTEESKEKMRQARLKNPIKSFALYPELRFDVSNGRTLCVPCHRQTETWGVNFKYQKNSDAQYNLGTIV